MGLTSIQWDAMEAAQKDALFSRQLWIEANFQVGFIFDEEMFLPPGGGGIPYENEGVACRTF